MILFLIGLKMHDERLNTEMVGNYKLNLLS